MNPSVADDKEFVSSREYLFTIGNLKEGLSAKSIKNIKMKIVFERFYEKPFKLIKEIDPNVCLFWEDKETFERIHERIQDNKKYSEIKSALEEIEGIIGKEEADNFLIFAELVYYRYAKQSGITNVIENDQKLKGDIQGFLKKQIEYYSPDYIIVASAYVSKFFEVELLRRKPSKSIKNVKTVGEYNGKKVFLSSMFSGGKIDNYSLKRLQNEIKENLDRED